MSKPTSPHVPSVGGRRLIGARNRTLLIIPILATLAGSVWLISLGSSATALWRDEVHTVNVSVAPSFERLWQHLEFESFPLLGIFLLRGWVAVVGSTDLDLRTFGLLNAFLMIGGVWIAARGLGTRAPALSLALIATNPELLRWAASVRPWGVGAGLAAVTLPAMLKVVEAPTRRRMIVAIILSVLSVQCLYQNAILLAATIAACCVVALRQSAPGRAGLVIGIGAVAAASLLPYASVISRRAEWNALGSAVIVADDLIQKAWEVVTAPGLLAGVLWATLAAAAVLVSLLHLFRSRTTRSDVAIFGGVVVAVSAVGLLALYLQIGYPTQPWYYVGLIVVAGVSAESAIGAALGARRAGPVLALAGLIVIGTVASAGGSVWATSRVPYTNIDRVSAYLEQSAVAGDLIVANPWFLGITLSRYHRGAARVDTIPDISDRSIARYDLLKANMTRPYAIAPLLERIAQTLQAGRRVWFVGNFELPPTGITQADLKLPMPPLPERGWSSAPYEALWSFQAALFLNSNAVAGRRVPVEVGGPFESALLLEFSGWRDQPPEGK